jgi:superfamily I DNA/RNA helicase
MDPEDQISLRYLLGTILLKLGSSGDFRSAQYKILQSVSEEDGITVGALLENIISGETSLNKVKQITDAYREIKTLTENIKGALRTNQDSLFDELFVNDEESAYELAELRDIFKSSLLENEDFTGDDSESEDWIKNVINLFQKQVTNPEIPEDIDHVRIMSLHSSKGLSSKVVIVYGLVDELIPGSDLDSDKIEEQRRLFYVAVTRCKADDSYSGKLVLSSFLSIDGKDALSIGIVPSSAGRPRRVRSTRFMTDFTGTAPAATTGEEILTDNT